jgi:hypothetical protein
VLLCTTHSVKNRAELSSLAAASATGSPSVCAPKGCRCPFGVAESEPAVGHVLKSLYLPPSETSENSAARLSVVVVVVVIVIVVIVIVVVVGGMVRRWVDLLCNDVMVRVYWLITGIHCRCMRERPRTSIPRTVFHAWLLHCDDYCADTQSALVSDVDGRTIACGVQAERWTGPQLGADALQHAPLMPWQQVPQHHPSTTHIYWAEHARASWPGGRATYNGILDPAPKPFWEYRCGLGGWVWVWMTVHFHNPAQLLQKFQIRIQSLLPKILHLSTRLTLKHPLLLGLLKWRYSHVYKMMI